MDRNDYPYLYRAADELALNYQKRHFYLLISYLVLLILGVLIPLFSNGNWINLIVLLIFIISAIIYIISKIWNPLNLWYNGRAVAESVKSMTWKWMMSAEPYQYRPRENNQRKFKEDLKELLRQNEILFNHYQNEDNNFYTISDKMQNVRSMQTAEKLSFYNKNRVEDQLKWYRKKAKKQNLFFYLFSGIVGAFYLVIIIFMVCKIFEPSKEFPIDLCSTIIAALVAWIEAKNYNDQASAYSLTVNEISIIHSTELTGQVAEEELSEYVINSENAFSREHTQWLARKH